MAGLLARSGALALLLLSLAACTGTDSGMGVSDKESNDGSSARFPKLGGEDKSQPADTSQSAAPGTSSQQTTSSKQAGAVAPVHFAPVIGAPADKVTALAGQLGPAAQRNGVPLEGSDMPAGTYQLKGYFSAFIENGDTVVVHVWDVISPSGQRVHRIQGQEKVPGGEASNPWQVVGASTMASIAGKVIGEYAAWQRQSG